MSLILQLYFFPHQGSLFSTTLIKVELEYHVIFQLLILQLRHKNLKNSTITLHITITQNNLNFFFQLGLYLVYISQLNYWALKNFATLHNYIYLFHFVYVLGLLLKTILFYLIICICVCVCVYTYIHVCHSQSLKTMKYLGGN